MRNLLYIGAMVLLFAFLSSCRATRTYGTPSCHLIALPMKLETIPTEVKLLSLVVEGDATEHGFVDDVAFSDQFMPPRYQGGWGRLVEYIATEITYPVFALERGIKGEVTVLFGMNKDGTIGEVEVFRSPDRSLDAEVVRVVKDIPFRWLPAIREHVFINSTVTVRVGFDFK